MNRGSPPRDNPDGPGVVPDAEDSGAGRTIRRGRFPGGDVGPRDRSRSRSRSPRRRRSISPSPRRASRSRSPGRRRDRSISPRRGRGRSRSRSPPRGGGGGGGGGREPYRRFSNSRSRSRSRSPDADVEPMMTYKQFVADEVADNVLPAEAQRMYSAYQESYSRRAAEAFFDSHRHEEWFREQYDPVTRVARIDARKEDAKRTASTYLAAAESNDSLQTLLRQLADKQQSKLLSDAEAEAVGPAAGAADGEAANPDAAEPVRDGDVAAERDQDTERDAERDGEGDRDRERRDRDQERSRDKDRDAEGEDPVDRTVLFVRDLPPVVSRSVLHQLCKSLPGFLRTTWCPPAVYSRRGSSSSSSRYRRSAWVQFDTEKHAEHAEDVLRNRELLLPAARECVAVFRELQEPLRAGMGEAVPGTVGGGAVPVVAPEEADQKAANDGSEEPPSASADTKEAADGDTDMNGGAPEGDGADAAAQDKSQDKPQDKDKEADVTTTGDGATISYRDFQRLRLIAPIGGSSKQTVVRLHAEFRHQRAARRVPEDARQPEIVAESLRAASELAIAFDRFAGCVDTAGTPIAAALMERMHGLPAANQLDVIVNYMRDVHCYCFFAGTQYQEPGDMWQRAGRGFKLVSGEKVRRLPTPSEDARVAWTAAKNRLESVRIFSDKFGKLQHRARLLQSTIDKYVAAMPRAALLEPFLKEACVPHDYGDEKHRCSFSDKKLFKSRVFAVKHVLNKHAEETEAALAKATEQGRTILALAITDRDTINAYMADPDRPMPYAAQDLPRPRVPGPAWNYPPGPRVPWGYPPPVRGMHPPPASPYGQMPPRPMFASPPPTAGGWGPGANMRTPGTGPRYRDADAPRGPPPPTNVDFGRIPVKYDDI